MEIDLTWAHAARRSEKRMRNSTPAPCRPDPLLCVLVLLLYATRTAVLHHSLMLPCIIMLPCFALHAEDVHGGCGWVAAVAAVTF